MNKLKFKYANNLLFSIIATLCFLLPDFLFGTIKRSFTFVTVLDITFFVFLSSFLLSFIKNKKILYSVFILFSIIQFIEINHIIYFGIPISTKSIGEMLSCYDEVIASGMEVFAKLIPFWGVFVFSLVVQCITINKLPRQHLKVSIIPIFIYIVGYFMLCLVDGLHLTYLKPQNTSLRNGVNVFASYFIYETKEKQKIPYLPITKKIINGGVHHIVLIMGESTNSRFLSLYGYPHDTTPFLKSIKNSKGFAYTKGISSGPGTSASIPLFFNMQREIQYIVHNDEKECNLFKIAKEQNYKTILHTCHTKRHFFDSGIEFIDESTQTQYINRIENPQNNSFRKIPAEYNLLSTLKETTLSDKNFIVLHPYAVHTPYEAFHPLIKNPIDFPISDPIQLSYAKALQYFDEWIETTVNIVREKVSKDALIIFVSDHGELINEDGLCGHGFLKPIVSDIALFAFGPDDHPFLEWIRSHPYISHYDLGVKIAELMGVEINNPNDDGKMRYIQVPSPGKVHYIPWSIENNHPHFLKDEIRS